MEKSRAELYQSLFEQVANTPLIPYEGHVPNGNRIVIKRECDLPYGSHYDRVFLHLFHHYEQAGKIKPGNKVFETTSGSAGVSFAGLGKDLGYECFVAIPEGGDRARENAILEYLPDQSHLVLTPAKDGMGGLPRFLKRYLVKNKDQFFLNHSMGKPDKGSRIPSNNETTLVALENIGREVSNEQIDCFVSAVGNGSNLLGIGRVLKPKVSVVAYETFQAAVAYDLKYPDRYASQFGINPGTLSRHKLPGTSFNGIVFPHIRNAAKEGIIDEVVLVSDGQTDREYEGLTTICNAQFSPISLPHWDADIGQTGDLGRTTKAGLAVALSVAEKLRDKNILVIGYDKDERYDQVVLG